jgi:hexokinase/galactokinase
MRGFYKKFLALVVLFTFLFSNVAFAFQKNQSGLYSLRTKAFSERDRQFTYDEAIHTAETALDEVINDKGLWDDFENSINIACEAKIALEKAKFANTRPSIDADVAATRATQKAYEEVIHTTQEAKKAYDKDPSKKDPKTIQDAYKKTLTAAEATYADILEVACTTIPAFEFVGNPPQNYDIERVVAGRINPTFRLTDNTTKRKYIIQKLNPIFDTGAINENLQLLEQAQVEDQGKQPSQRVLPQTWQPVHYLNAKGQSGKVCYVSDPTDPTGNKKVAWRVMDHIPEPIKIFNKFEQVRKELPPNEAKEIAQNLGAALVIFRRMLETIDQDKWKEPLPGFHNHPYYPIYLKAIMDGEEVDLCPSKVEGRPKIQRIENILENANYKDRINTLKAKIKQRGNLAYALEGLGKAVSHNDPKLNNLIFKENKETGRLECISIIDLDTVQLGNELDDLGDALRSAGNPAGSDAKPGTINIDMPTIENIIEGYLAKIGEEEAKRLRPYVYDAARLFCYELSIRYFADFLTGDVYFKLKDGERKDANLCRAETNMEALEKLEEALGAQISHEAATELVSSYIDTARDIIPEEAKQNIAIGAIIDLRMGIIARAEAEQKLSAAGLDEGIADAWIIKATSPLAMALQPQTTGEEERTFGTVFNWGLLNSPALWMNTSSWLELFNDRDRAFEFLRQYYGDDVNLLEDRRQALISQINFFVQRFGHNDVAIFRAPGRAMFIGQHTDRAGAMGDVNRYAVKGKEVFIIAKRNNDSSVTIACPESRFLTAKQIEDFNVTFDLAGDLYQTYPQPLADNYTELSGAADSWDVIAKRIETDLDAVTSKSPRHFLSGAAFLINNYFRKKTNSPTPVITTGIDFVMEGNIPPGIGISSSSATVISTAMALCAANGIEVVERGADPFRKQITFKELCDLMGYGEWIVGTRGGTGDHAVIIFGHEGGIINVGVDHRAVLDLPKGMTIALMNTPPRDYDETQKTTTPKAAAKADQITVNRVISYNLALVFLREFGGEKFKGIKNLIDIFDPARNISDAEVLEAFKRVPDFVSRQELQAVPGISPEGAEAIRNIIQDRPREGLAEGPWRARAVGLSMVADLKRSSVVFPTVLKDPTMSDEQKSDLLFQMAETSMIGQRMEDDYGPADIAPWQKPLTDADLDTAIQGMQTGANNPYNNKPWSLINLTDLESYGVASWHQSMLHKYIKDRLTQDGLDPSKFTGFMQGAGLGGAILAVIDPSIKDKVMKYYEEYAQANFPGEYKLWLDVPAGRGAEAFVLRREEMLTQIESALSISAQEMQGIITQFHSEMENGLRGEPSSLAMIPTYVEMPTGREKGRFLAMDLGGSNFRVLSVELKGNAQFGPIVIDTFQLQDEHIKGTAEDLFGFTADSLGAFMKMHAISQEEALKMGYTFSFQVEQTGIASGRLVKWTKEFSATGVKGRDVVELQRKSFAKRKLDNIEINALCNDTVGALMAIAYTDPNSDVGVILGTGTNACYPEELSNIPKWQGSQTPSGRMIVNMEWGNFNLLKQTPYDQRLDMASAKPGESIFEKMISGMYLGEVARLICQDLISRGMLFSGRSSAVFNKPYSFKTEDMSKIAADKSSNLWSVSALLTKIGIPNSTIEDRRLIEKICGLVSTRAARLSAAAIATVVTKMDPELSRPHTIAIDGSLFEKYPDFEKRMRDALVEIFGPAKAGNIKMVLAKDGSGKGAAIIAAVVASTSSQPTPLAQQAEGLKRGEHRLTLNGILRPQSTLERRTPLVLTYSPKPAIDKGVIKEALNDLVGGDSNIPLANRLWGAANPTPAQAAEAGTLIESAIESIRALAMQKGRQITDKASALAFMNEFLGNINIIVASGKGTRLGGEIPKQRVKADGANTVLRQAREGARIFKNRDVIAISPFMAEELLVVGKRIDKAALKKIIGALNQNLEGILKRTDISKIGNFKKFTNGLKKDMELIMREVLLVSRSTDTDINKRKDISTALWAIERVLNDRIEGLVPAAQKKLVVGYLTDEIAALILDTLLEDPAYLDKGRVADIIGQDAIITVAPSTGPGAAFRAGLEKLEKLGIRPTFVTPVYSDYATATLDEFPRIYLLAWLKAVKDMQQGTKVTIGAKEAVEGPKDKGQVRRDAAGFPIEIAEWRELQPAEQNRILAQYQAAQESGSGYPQINASIFVFDFDWVTRRLNEWVNNPAYDHPDPAKDKLHEWWYTDLVGMAYRKLPQLGGVISVGANAPAGVKDPKRLRAYRAKRDNMIIRYLRSLGVTVEHGARIIVSSPNGDLDLTRDLPAMVGVNNEITMRGFVQLEKGCTVGRGAVLDGRAVPVALRSNDKVSNGEVIIGTSHCDSQTAARIEQIMAGYHPAFNIKDKAESLLAGDSIEIKVELDRQPLANEVFSFKIPKIAGLTDAEKSRYKDYAVAVIASYLWKKGAKGAKVVVADDEIYSHLVQSFDPANKNKFSYQAARWMEGIYGVQKFVVERVNAITVQKVAQQERVEPDRSKKGIYLGIDFGGTDVKVVIIKDGKRIYEREHVWTPKDINGAEGRFGIVKKASAWIEAALRTAGLDKKDLNGIGVSTAGIVREDGLIVVSKLAQGLSVEDFREGFSKIKEHLSGRFNIPAMVVGDGKAGAVYVGEEMRLRDALVIAMGTTTAGSAVDIDGNYDDGFCEIGKVVLDLDKVLSGVTHLPPYRGVTKELPILGVNGTLRDFLSQLGVFSLAKELLKEDMGEQVTDNYINANADKVLKTIQQRVEQGNQKARVIAEVMGRYLSDSIITLRQYFPNRNVVLFGRVTRGEFGNIMISTAQRILDMERPELGVKIIVPTAKDVDDEVLKRFGQAIGAAYFMAQSTQSQRLAKEVNATSADIADGVLSRRNLDRISDDIVQFQKFVKQERGKERYNLISLGGGSCVSVQGESAGILGFKLGAIACSSDNGGLDAKMRKNLLPVLGHTIPVGDVTNAFKGLLGQWEGWIYETRGAGYDTKTERPLGWTLTDERFSGVDVFTAKEKADFQKETADLKTFEERVKKTVETYKRKMIEFGAPITQKFIQFEKEIINLARLVDKHGILINGQPGSGLNLNEASVRHTTFYAIMMEVGAYDAQRKSIDNNKFRVGLYLLEKAFSINGRISVPSLDYQELYAEWHRRSDGVMSWKSDETGPMSQLLKPELKIGGQVNISLAPDDVTKGADLTVFRLHPDPATAQKIQPYDEALEILDQVEEGGIVAIGPSSFVVSSGPSLLLLRDKLKALKGKVARVVVLNSTYNTETLTFKDKGLNGFIEFLEMSTGGPISDAVDYILVNTDLGEDDQQLANALRDKGDTSATYKERGPFRVEQHESASISQQRGITIVRAPFVKLALKSQKVKAGSIDRLTKPWAGHDPERLAWAYRFVSSDFRLRGAQQAAATQTFGPKGGAAFTFTDAQMQAIEEEVAQLTIPAGIGAAAKGLEALHKSQEVSSGAI